MPDEKKKMTPEELKAELEEALRKLGEIHPKLPNIILTQELRVFNAERDARFAREKVAALDERLTRFEEMGGVAIQKLAREAKRQVRKEKREERRIQKAVNKAGKKAAE